MSSNELCKACSLLEGLERGIAAAGIVSALDPLPKGMLIRVHTVD
jgi:hypothetical protein